ncbi:hypothetical protein ACVBEG_03055 [Pseudomonas sp. GG8]
MSESKMREEFEKAVALEAGEPILAVYLSRRNDTYSTSTLHFAWWAWKQSREALVIECPEKCEFAEPDGSYHKGYRQGMRSMVDAIEAAGLKVSQ